mmetsp:Transcript_23242/g.58737  ORF Transcript_23242/g.58737 Transcript_23242/m.58737 type:complete len:266 (+) Transcript_23242:1846-2643(+)
MGNGWAPGLGTIAAFTKSLPASTTWRRFADHVVIGRVAREASKFESSQPVAKARRSSMFLRSASCAVEVSAPRGDGSLSGDITSARKPGQNGPSPMGTITNCAKSCPTSSKHILVFPSIPHLFLSPGKTKTTSLVGPSLPSSNPTRCFSIIGAYGPSSVIGSYSPFWFQQALFSRSYLTWGKTESSWNRLCDPPGKFLCRKNRIFGEFSALPPAKGNRCCCVRMPVFSFISRSVNTMMVLIWRGAVVWQRTSSPLARRMAAEVKS